MDVKDMSVSQFYEYIENIDRELNTAEKKRLDQIESYERYIADQTERLESGWTGL